MSNQYYSLSGKSVVILGGSTGLGFATAQAAASEGAHVIIVSSNQEKIDKALSRLPATVRGAAVDLSKEENIKVFFDKADPFDHLVYTAGENLKLSNVAETDISLAKTFLTLRFWGAFAAVKYATAKIKPGGSINLTGGIAGQRPGKGWALAAAICGSMEGFVRALAVELAPIRVNSVVPGIVRTNLWDSMNETDRNNLFESVANALPVKRIGDAEDIAQAFLYLMKQGFGTGQNVVVDGGAVLV